MTQIIALSGYKQSGKDTVGNLLVQNYGFRRFAFADILKDMVSEQYGVARGDLDHPTRKEEPITHLPVIPTDKFTVAIHALLTNELASGFWTPRALCILEGSVKRGVHSNYWLGRVADRIRANPGNYVITDMRYKSEADTLRMLFPSPDSLELWRIERFATVNTTDPSERDLDDYTQFTTRIANLGSMADLDFSVNSLMGTRMNALQKRTYDAWGTYIP